MIRNLLCAAFVLTLSLGLAMADTIKGARITKIEDGKITATVGAKKGEPGEVKTFDVAKDCKVCKMDKKDKVEVTGGLKADELKNIDAKKGIGATLEVTDGKVTEIILGGGKKKAAN